MTKASKSATPTAANVGEGSGYCEGAIGWGSGTVLAPLNFGDFDFEGFVSETMITGIGVYYPDGTETQRVGIIPDIEVKPTIEGVKAGRDELLEKAMEVIENE